MQRGLVAETLIGVLSPRSCLTIIAFLGILKAGLAYLPLDVNAPGARIEAIISSVAGHKLVLLGNDVAAPAIQGADIEFVPIIATLHEPAQAEQLPQRPLVASTAPSATSLAYVMFTSGSTGKPKGVMVEHRGVVRMASELSRIWGAVPIAHMANTTFDASTSEIYTAILYGGTVICVDAMAVLDSAGLGNVFKMEGVRVASFTPAVLKQCLIDSPSTIGELDVLFVMGDRCDPKDTFKALRSVRGHVFNAYGPSENTVISTLYRMLPEERCVNGVPIGRAVSNSGAYVMDPQQRLVPVGVIGELVVTGDGVARGYTNPEWDHGRFVCVIIDGQSVKAYRTGDYVRCRPVDGQLEFFGRMDYQVKIRGHRIELPEVEHALLAFEDVSDAVVLARERDGQDLELISFVTVRKPERNEPNGSGPVVECLLRGRLEAMLPSYMVPAVIQVLEKMPVNANGKVDRRALAKSAKLATPNKALSARVPARDEVERVLCEEFASVLGIEVGITDNLFDLGGHSLMAARLATRISSRLRHKIYIFDVLKSPTPAMLSHIIRTKSTAENPNCTSRYLEPHIRPHSRLTIVLVHGFWGQGSIFSSLVPSLDDAFDVLLIHDPFFDQPHHPETITEWAEIYLNDIEKLIPPHHGLVLGGYSFGGLIAFEMALLWRNRHGNNPTSLILIDAGTYTTTKPSTNTNSDEVNYALQIFGESQKDLVLNHFNKVAPLLCNVNRSPIYQGACLYLVTPETMAAGALEWWSARCSKLDTHRLSCTHHTVLDDAMVRCVGELINEHCYQATQRVTSPTKSRV
ncbi:putative NRPS-like protein biosynthetic cluster [Microsporum canis]